MCIIKKCWAFCTTWRNILWSVLSIVVCYYWFFSIWWGYFDGNCLFFCDYVVNLWDRFCINILSMKNFVSKFLNSGTSTNVQIFFFYPYPLGQNRKGISGGGYPQKKSKILLMVSILSFPQRLHISIWLGIPCGWVWFNTEIMEFSVPNSFNLIVVWSSASWILIVCSSCKRN